MYVRSLADCAEITANDNCRLREVLHPDKDGQPIRYSFAIAWVEPGQATHPHTLRQTEVYYLIRGQAIMHIDDEARPVAAGDAVVIPPDSVQWIENTGPERLEFAAIVDPPWQADDDRRIHV